jgi:phosphatidylethanolamine/phosphatidyl-N-methylethanolamine N-methyltransferase
MNKRQFLQRFLKEKKSIGAMAPSSKFLATKMLEKVHFKTANIIVELGPGTGIFTEQIISSMCENARLIIIELDEVFYRNLKENINHPNVEVVLGSAAELPKILSDRNIDFVDVIISSLPLANFSSTLKSRILSSCKQCLNIESGQFIQFQYTLRSHRLLKRVFPHVNVDFTVFNLPPAFVYSCKVN